MIIVQVGEPRNRNPGDVWFDPTTKITSRATQLTSGIMGGTQIACIWTPITVSYTALQVALLGAYPVGTVVVDANTQIPSAWDGTSWIPAVPSNYSFPKLPLSVGDVWTESISGTTYLYNGKDWISMAFSASVYNGNPQPIPIVCGINWAGSAAGNITISAAPPTQPRLILGANNSIQIKQPQTGDLVVDIDFANQTIKYGITYTPDEAAKSFWTALMKGYPDSMISTLRQENKQLADELREYKDAGFKLPKKQAPIDPNDAWDAAMGIIK